MQLFINNDGLLNRNITVIMKLLTTIGFSILFGSAVFSQDLDARLLERYSEKELTEMKSESPQDYRLLVYALDNAITYANYDAAKGNFETINADENSTFLSLGLEIKDQNQYFKLAGEDKLLVVKSKWVLTHEMEKK